MAWSLSREGTSRSQVYRLRIKELEGRNKELEQKNAEFERRKRGRTPDLVHYNMSSLPRGLCVIINNIEFHNKADNRIGADIDGSELEDLFNELSFTVSVYNDLRRDEMKKVAAKFAAKDHTRFHAFVFVVMSHGGERDVIYGVDGRRTRVEDLLAEFKAPNCPTLKNKPKLFFIQACRGSSKDVTFSATADSFGRYMDAFSPDSILPRSVCRGPKEADFLLAFATTPGYVSWRNKESGSWFIQTLVEVIRERHFQDHLLDMLTEVNRLVAEKGKRVCQVPAPVHTLRAKLYL